MTILVAYVPRPEGQVALDKGIEIATRNKEDLIVVTGSLYLVGALLERWSGSAPL